MRCRYVQLGVLTAGLALVGSASAQEVVHALSGTVVKMDTAGKTLEIQTNDGSEGVFSLASVPKATTVALDKNVESHTTAVTSLGKASDEVVVFFYGNGNVRNAIAVQDLGPGPFQAVEGSVTRYDRHKHALTIKNGSGKEQTFTLDPKAVADTMDGAVPGDRFSPAKGDNVRVVFSQASPQTAAFIRD